MKAIESIIKDNIIAVLECYNNGRAHFKKYINNCLNTNIYSYLETSGGQCSNLYINVINFINTSVD